MEACLKQGGRGIAVPREFQSLATVQAPYRIVNPGAGPFSTGEAQASYYTSYVDHVWSSNGLTIPTPGPNLSGLAAYPDLSAALNRHTAAAGTFAPDGTLTGTSMWSNPATFYASAPANYYAQFWHENAIDGKAYGFPYDDVGGYSKNPQSHVGRGFESGGDVRIRTADPLHAKQVLYQLSYTPTAGRNSVPNRLD